MFASPDQLHKTILLVTGGRHYARRKRLFRFLDRLVREVNVVLVVAGECETGTDQFAKQWAKERGIPYRGYPANWEDMTVKPLVKRYRADGTPYNAAAGNIRNRQMRIESRANLVVATEGGSGTQDMVKQAKKAGLTVLQVD